MEPKLVLFPEIWIIIGNFQIILVIIYWHFLIISLRYESPQVKRYLISTIKYLVHELPPELSNDLKFLEKNVLEKCQIWVETQPNSQSSFQKLNVHNSCQKTHKIRHYIFEVLSNFAVFLYCVPNILARIVVKERCTRGSASFQIVPIHKFYQNPIVCFIVFLCNAKSFASTIHCY